MSAKTFPIDVETSMLVADSFYTNTIDCNQINANGLTTQLKTATYTATFKNQANATLSTSTGNFSYVKIGRFVHIYLPFITFTNIGSVNKLEVTLSAAAVADIGTIALQSGTYPLWYGAREIRQFEVSNNLFTFGISTTWNGTDISTTGTVFDKTAMVHTLYLQ